MAHVEGGTDISSQDSLCSGSRANRLIIVHEPRRLRLRDRRVWICGSCGGDLHLPSEQFDGMRIPCSSHPVLISWIPLHGHMACPLTAANLSPLPQRWRTLPPLRSSGAEIGGLPSPDPTPGPASTSGTSGPPPVAPSTTTPRGTFQELWAILDDILKEERSKSEAINAELRDRIRDIFGGGRGARGREEVPVALSGDRAGGSVGAVEMGEDPSTTTHSGDQEGEIPQEGGRNEGIADPIEVAPRPSFLTWAMVLASVGIFVQQWWPLLPYLKEGVCKLDGDTLLAFLLASPDTPWRLVRGAWPRFPTTIQAKFIQTYSNRHVAPLSSGLTLILCVTSLNSR